MGWLFVLGVFVCLFGFVFGWIMLIRRASFRASSLATFALGALVDCLASLPRCSCHLFHVNAISLVSPQRLLVVVVFLFGFVGVFVGVLVCLVWSGFSLCFFACLRSFTDCIAHKQHDSCSTEIDCNIQAALRHLQVTQHFSFLPS